MANNSSSIQSNTVQEGQQIKSTIGRSNPFNEFFWMCSGANRHILRQCPTEYSKYFGIGGTIFFTAAMATLSGGYAFYTILNRNFTGTMICFSDYIYKKGLFLHATSSLFPDKKLFYLNYYSISLT